MRYLIWGGNGWIGSMICSLLKDKGHEVIIATARLQDYVGICQEIININPDRVINCAGITGRPTVDWCESNQQETYLINSIGCANLADACWRHNKHLTYYGTGCIYAYDDEHPIGSVFTEDDRPNFKGSTYSKSKILAEELLSVYDNVLILRIRMPISADLNPKSLITKLTKYTKVINIPNSVTILPDLLPVSLFMMEHKLTGIYNLTNPGTVTHNDILNLYREHVDPEFVWGNFTEEEQNKILKSKRSNCALSSDKLLNIAPIPNIRDSLVNIMKTLK